MAPVAPNVDILGPCRTPFILDIDFLLPNGLLLSLEFNQNTTLQEIRFKVLEEAKKYESIDQILALSQNENEYILTSVTHEAKLVEFYDYNKRLSELKLFYPTFKLVEANGNLEEKSYNCDLSKSIGLYVNELDQIKESEFCDFRLELFKLVKEFKLKNPNLLDVIYSPNLELNPNLLDFNYISSKLNSVNLYDVKIDFNIHVSESNKPDYVYNFCIPLNYTPTDIICLLIKTKLKKACKTELEIEEVIEQYKDMYLFNICGCDEVIFGNKHKIGSYKYIKNCLSNGNIPNFYLITKDKLKHKLSTNNTISINLINKYVENGLQNSNYQEQLSNNQFITELSWNMNENFNIHLESLIYVPYIKECDKIFFKISILQAQELKYQIESDKFDYDKIVGKDSSLRLNKYISFDYKIKYLHRCDKISISVFCITKRKKEFFSIGYITLNLFDYKGNIMTGKKKLYLWQNNYNQNEITGQNPEKDYMRLNIQFLINKPANLNILYPDVELIKKLIPKTNTVTQDECIDISYALENNNYLLETILNKDSLSELSEQEKNVLWRRREDCLNYPHSLPKLLQSVKWSNKQELIEFYSLLFKWPKLKPVQAIELLNPINSDLEVRKFAVKCLDLWMKDEEVSHYLLQLVQSLKNEPYYNSELSKFLLKRGLHSQRIGFNLFWLLKTEMKNVKYKYKIGLILESYCRGLSNNQLKELIKQIECVDKLENICLSIKSNTDYLQLIKSNYLNDILQTWDYLNNIISPLNMSHVLGKINANNSRILTSAKKPIYLSWFNNFEYSKFYQQTFELIFKHGDDLRQDMLTLQILKLMDIIWKNEGLDLKMLIYDCFSTGSRTGFIQVIKNSMTLFKIQMEGGMKGRYQIDTSQLFKWIMNNNIDNLEESVELFTRSCAGFCVATFILGIGDRHPDNIMINKNGQIFHIDFGHFLGHFKKKYGIKRERVPFVLTEDFTKVITKGALNPLENEKFGNFRELCEKSYMIIRRYAHLIINLFVLMLSSDMPELQSIEDITYLRKTLAVDDTDEKALEYFRYQFNEAYRLSYTTKLDWMCHALNKKNLL